MKKLLILGGIKSECEIVLHAKKRGIYTIVADYLSDSPAKEIADKSILLDALNSDEIVKFCKKEKVDGIITGFVDILLPGYMNSCNNLGLPCYITPKMLSMSTDKIDFKETCEEFNIPVPKTFYIGNSLTRDVLKKIVYPVFVKPLDASGSRGCSTCNNELELVNQFGKALESSKTKTAIIEELLCGREFLLNYIGVNGNFYLIEMFDRFMAEDRKSARNYSNVSLSPSFALDNYCLKIDSKVKTMFKKLGFKDGLIFLQGFYDKHNNIKLYEMGCRLGGSFPYLEQACLGINSIDMLINYALRGTMVDHIPINISEMPKFNGKYGVVNNYLLSGKNETIYSVNGIEKIKNSPYYVAHILHRKIGSSYGVERIVDKPIISFNFVCNNLKEVRDSIKYQNSVFDVCNPDGKSILTKKIDPDSIRESQ